ncbi:MAG: hypothetical protein KDE51_02785 [Anaerolineales bacterium]|nr:hypothetical protein [Anaerolineales bacterium]
MTNSPNHFGWYLPYTIREYIEQTYYARINSQATLEKLVDDESFRTDPLSHIALASDRGIVHVRDVAQQLLAVLDAVNGVLIPARDHNRLDYFMKGYGVIIAYMHDIGIANFSSFGRIMHPEFASQQIFEPSFDPIIDTIWEENSGNIVWRLVRLANTGVLEQDPKIVLREMIAMSNCHSKVKVPVELLNNPQRLRQTMQETIGTPLQTLYHKHQARSIQKALAQAPLTEKLTLEQTWREAEMLWQESNAASKAVAELSPALGRFYNDLETESFRWLVSDQPDVQELVQDIIDTLRALRCADALRQRGSVLKTSGNYEIFIDQTTANAIYAMRKGDSKLFLIETSDPLSAGEANIASSELDQDGNLRVSFHRGAFQTPEIIQRAAQCVALVVNDIQADVIESFKRPLNETDNIKAWNEIRVLLEGVNDNVDFAGLVENNLKELNPELNTHVQTVPSMQTVSDLERKMYFDAPELDWDLEKRKAVLAKIEKSGHNISKIDLFKGFEHVRVVTLEGGKTLIEANTPASFVYIPLSEGLMIHPLGGYPPFAVKPWMPLGNTGVVRGADRNATVTTTQNMELLMIPKETFLRWWHKPFYLQEFIHQLRDLSSPNGSL